MELTATPSAGRKFLFLGDYGSVDKITADSDFSDFLRLSPLHLAPAFCAAVKRCSSQPALLEASKVKSLRYFRVSALNCKHACNRPKPQNVPALADMAVNLFQNSGSSLSASAVLAFLRGPPSLRKPPAFEDSSMCRAESLSRRKRGAPLEPSRHANPPPFGAWGGCYGSNTERCRCSSPVVLIFFDIYLAIRACQQIYYLLTANFIVKGGYHGTREIRRRNRRNVWKHRRNDLCEKSVR